MRGFRGFTLVELPVVRKGFTLIELVVVIAIIALLIAIILPSLSRAKNLARLTCCAANLSAIGKSLGGYASENATRLPPFMFSSAGATDLLLSGHWGGTTNPLDPDRFGGRDKTGAEAVNLWVLVVEQFLQRESLICPGADRRLLERAASYFPYTDQFSTYCLRFPPSEDLFDTAPALAYRFGGLLGIYKMQAGGQPAVRIDSNTVLRVPQVFWGRRYRVNGRDFCAGADSLVADVFWMQGDYQPGGDQTADVARGVCHGPQYNVLSGGGVRTVTDDGTIAENAVASGEAPPSAGRPYAEKAHILWTFFDDAK